MRFHFEEGLRASADGPNENRKSGRRGRESRWARRIPIVVAVVGAALTFLPWRALKSQEQAHIGRMMELAAGGTRADLEEDFESRIEPLVRLAKHWETYRQPNRKELEADAALLTGTYMGYRAVEWVDASFRVRWVVPLKGNEADQGRDLASDAMLRPFLEASQNQNQNQIRFLRYPQRWSGEKVFLVAVPVFPSGSFDGFALGVLRQDALNKALEDDIVLGYSVAVFDGGEQIYGPSDFHRIPEARWAKEITIQFHGVTWQAIVWPEPELLASMRSPVSEKTVLAAGFFIALLLGLTTHLAQTARNHAKHIESVNEELKQEIIERQRAEEALRKTRDGLEEQVRLRTAELASTNIELRAEIVERNQAEESLRELSGRLLELQDEERRRIARDLHDSTAQNLAALATNLAFVEEGAEGLTPRARNALSESLGLAEECFRDIRTISHLLHPPLLDEFGLLPALRWYTNAFSERTGICVDLNASAELGRLPAEVERAMFRIVQGSLTNIHQHSGSRVAKIYIVRDASRVTLEVSDQGRGIPPQILKQFHERSPVAGVGIAGVRERARQLGGNMEIDSGSNGTTLRLVLPLSPDNEAPHAG